LNYEANPGCGGGFEFPDESVGGVGIRSRAFEQRRSVETVRDVETADRNRVFEARH
jgi:hypothetical protein